MTKTLPPFRYHPDPVANGIVAKSDVTCVCCGFAPGYIYRGPVFAVEDLDAKLCPWCIAEGSAAKRYEATFTDEAVFTNELAVDPSFNPSIIEEVTTRTPGYSGWQQETWLTHCNDACAYLGFPTIAELDGAWASAVAGLVDNLGLSEREWHNMRRAYVPGGSQPQGRVGFYKFQCLHCQRKLLASDAS